MKIEKGDYAIVALDDEDFEIGGIHTETTLKDAKQRAKLVVKSEELIAGGMTRVEIYNDRAECIDCYFVDTE